MEEESPNSTESLIGKLQELFTDSDNDVGQFPLKEEMIEEFMQELYKEIACSPLPKPLPPATKPLPSLPPSHAPNTKDEIPGAENGSLQDGMSDEFVGFEADGEEEKIKKMEQGFEDDDEWLARVLGWGQVIMDTNQSGFGFIQNEMDRNGNI